MCAESLSVNPMAMERLRRAAEAGDIDELYNSIGEDADVLRLYDDAEFADTPLHVAAERGHADFAIAIMYLKPSFARKLNQGVFSPIHLALQQGHTSTVLRLLDVDKDLVRVKGKQGYTAFHYVVENENLELLAQFLKDCPACIEDVTIQKKTALHIAAENHRFEALEILVRWLERTHLYGKVSRKHLLNAKDTDGNTVLHIAASHNQPEMIRLLLDCKVDTKAVNSENLTALNVLKRQRDGVIEDKEICLKILRDTDGSAGLSALFNLKAKAEPVHEKFRSRIIFPEKVAIRALGPIMNMSVESMNALLVALALIMTAIYESLLSPPGGVWQGNDPNDTRVGNSVMDVNTFSNFFWSLFVLAIFTLSLTIAILQLATGSSAIAILAEVLAVLVTRSFYYAWWTIRPAHDIYVYSKDPDEAVLAIVLITLACMEASRWFLIISKRLYLNHRM
ncbi:PREDICTED: ankyrin repeat and death domain-containing protein 1A isoform X1 [Theobroma cacao]|uniref:Ankyrin repeat and death domain-containing protein 1A isoform X1 n=2 Tax=Theobroma cacao TaxID=3641 RepID=A0AB32UM47_THECC|nr:PREDICTED: ankyrin repeat and death domain-containing protein 1A isoform X1 [Theobroma cacao]